MLMKRILAVCFVTAMALSFASCGMFGPALAPAAGSFAEVEDVDGAGEPDADVVVAVDSDGDVSSADVRYDNDYVAYDDIIDPMAESIMALDPGFTHVSVRHYADGDNSFLSYLTAKSDGVDWRGTLCVERAKGETIEKAWYATDGSFERHVKCLVDWYGEEPLAGDVDGNYVVFVREESCGIELDFAFCDDEYYVEGNVDTHISTDVAVAVERMNQMIETAGIQSLVTVSVD